MPKKKTCTNKWASVQEWFSNAFAPLSTEERREAGIHTEHGEGDPTPGKPHSRMALTAVIGVIALLLIGSVGIYQSHTIGGRVTKGYTPTFEQGMIKLGFTAPVARQVLCEIAANLNQEVRGPVWVWRRGSLEKRLNTITSKDEVETGGLIPDGHTADLLRAMSSEYPEFRQEWVQAGLPAWAAVRGFNILARARAAEIEQAHGKVGQVLFIRSGHAARDKYWYSSIDGKIDQYLE